MKDGVLFLKEISYKIAKNIRRKLQCLSNLESVCGATKAVQLPTFN
jgi:hypothetical protein